MTKAELFGLLEELPDEAEIKIAFQPNYPLMASIENICILRHEGDAEEAVIACRHANEYGSRRYWEENEVETDGNGELIEDED